MVMQHFMEEPAVRQNVAFSHHPEEPRPKLQPRSPTIEWPVRKPDGPPPLPPRSKLVFSLNCHLLSFSKLLGIEEH